MHLKNCIGLLALCVVLASGCNSTLLTRSYSIPRSAFKTLIEVPDSGTGAPALVEKQGAPIVDADIQRFFVESGVKFPKGAYIKYGERREALTIRNTPENIERAEGIMTETDGSKPRRL